MYCSIVIIINIAVVLHFGSIETQPGQDSVSAAADDGRQVLFPLCNAGSQVLSRVRVAERVP